MTDSKDLRMLGHSERSSNAVRARVRTHANSERRAKEDKPAKPLFPSYAILEVGTGRIDGWYARLAEARGMRDYYASEFPEHRYVVMPFTRENAKALGLGELGYFSCAQKIPPWRGFQQRRP